jgi:two-component system cell cycle response regulator
MKVLIAEDELTFQHMLKTFLSKWGYEVVVSSDGLQAWKTLQGENRPRLAILDWMMPGMDGVHICRAVRKSESIPYVYLLLLTTRDQKQDIVEGIEAGADDYLIKPFDPHELRARIRTGERIIELQESLLRTQEELRVQATHDALTGLLNRRASLDALSAELDRGRREKKPLCLVMADIDHFKKVNDTHGHPAGDVVLREVARRIQGSVRAYDTAGRFGGEEFLVIFPGCSQHQGIRQAERIREAVSAEPVAVRDKALGVTISLGVATTSEPDPEDIEGLLGAADMALYRAKEEGRNRVGFTESLRRSSPDSSASG